MKPLLCFTLPWAGMTPAPITRKRRMRDFVPVRTCQKGAGSFFLLRSAAAASDTSPVISRERRPTASRSVGEGAADACSLLALTLFVRFRLCVILERSEETRFIPGSESIQRCDLWYPDAICDGKNETSTRTNAQQSETIGSRTRNRSPDTIGAGRCWTKGCGFDWSTTARSPLKAWRLGVPIFDRWRR